MKKYLRYGFVLLSVMIALLLSGCPSPLEYDGGTGDTSQVATVSVDPSRGVAVFTEPDGRETVITSEEDGTFVDCIEVTDYIIVDDGGTSRHAGDRRHPRAIVLGVRSDGRPGVWVLYRGGIVVVPEGDSGDVTSELLEAASEGDGFRWDDGWSYEAVAISDDYRIIVGTAMNPDALWIADQLGTTPQVVVWWNLYEKDDGRFFLSRARAVAEYPEWSVDDVKSNHHGDARMRHVIRWLRWLFDRLGLWFFAWADDFLGNLAGNDVMGDLKPVATVGDGTYGIFGYDKAGDFAKATITPRTVLSIEKDEPPVDPGDPGENLPPWPVTGPSGDIEVTESNSSFFLEIRDDNGNLITNKDDFDPDQDPVTFEVELITIDNPGFDPQVTVTEEGEFVLTWDPGLTNSFIYATYAITTSDGKLSTPPVENIRIFIY